MRQLWPKHAERKEYHMAGLVWLSWDILGAFWGSCGVLGVWGALTTFLTMFDNVFSYMLTIFFVLVDHIFHIFDHA
jgi:hypothetical protein